MWIAYLIVNDIGYLSLRAKEEDRENLPAELETVWRFDHVLFGSSTQPFSNDRR